MSLRLTVVQESEMSEIFEYEKKKLAEIVADPNQRELDSWNAKWRKEALEHYLPLGWSFVARDPGAVSVEFPSGPLLGYFLAQPFLFFEGQTQSLWVEHLQHSSIQTRDELCELAYKLAREKHFQKIFFPNQGSIMNSIKHLKPEAWGASTYVIKTSKT